MTLYRLTGLGRLLPDRTNRTGYWGNKLRNDLHRVGCAKAGRKQIYISPGRVTPFAQKLNQRKSVQAIDRYCALWYIILRAFKIFRAFAQSRLLFHDQ
jgi:hypothetical protein